MNHRQTYGACIDTHATAWHGRECVYAALCVKLYMQKQQQQQYHTYSHVRAELARSHTEHSLRTQSISSIDIHHTKMYVLLFVRFSLVWDRFAIAFLFIPYVLYVYIRAIYFFLIQWKRGSESYMPSECE